MSDSSTTTALQTFKTSQAKPHWTFIPTSYNKTHNLLLSEHVKGHILSISLSENFYAKQTKCCGQWECIKEIFCYFAGPHAAWIYRHLIKRACPAECVRIWGVEFSGTLGCCYLCFEFDRDRPNGVLTCGFPYFVQALVCYRLARRTILWFIWCGVHKGPELCKIIKSQLA